ncbi:MAG TPA: ferredoxin [Chitinophagales bacterium]|jgi:ferredoxin|nr:ferredoxin [Chitinophagales bacterium]HPA36668.1 ferredoxin [Chitinophagales bacterium]HQO30768.1 ferredoxin [Chitinophagales bacterium]HQO89073.1 ferredoxin [Chitinophagales bacterium]
MITIIQQRAKCIGCNYCVELAPARWRMSRKDGKSVLLGATDKKGFWSVKVREDELEENLRAAKACPVHIIQVVE